MSQLTIKSPQIDWQLGFDKHWLEGSPVKSHVFNTLSFVFPQGERYFINVVREVVKQSKEPLTPELSQAVQGFITQEAVHTNQHHRYNAVLEKHGYENVVYELADRFQEQSYRFKSPLMRLAIVCGYEHFTAVMGNYILTNPQILESADPQLELIWGWHSAEETEHKSVCFDLYQAVGGGWLRRVAAFLWVSFNFSCLFLILYVNMLKKDGCLKRNTWFKTCVGAMKFFLGKNGVGRDLFKYGLSYFLPSFHPWQQDNRQALNQWLDAHRDRMMLIR